MQKWCFNQIFHSLAGNYFLRTYPQHVQILINLHVLHLQESDVAELLIGGIFYFHFFQIFESVEIFWKSSIHWQDFLITSYKKCWGQTVITKYMNFPAKLLHCEDNSLPNALIEHFGALLKEKPLHSKLVHASIRELT